MSESPLHRLIRRLEATTPLARQEREALLALPITVKDMAADKDIVREGDKPTSCCFVVEGFQCRYKMLPDGKRLSALKDAAMFELGYLHMRDDDVAA
jgi:hypothetical protein